MTGITEAELLAIFRLDIALSPEKFARTAWARRHGFSRSHTSNVLTGWAPITDRLAKALGYVRDDAGGFIPITNPAGERADRGGCNGRINAPSRPVSSEEAGQ